MPTSHIPDGFKGDAKFLLNLRRETIYLTRKLESAQDEGDLVTVGMLTGCLNNIEAAKVGYEQYVSEQLDQMPVYTEFLSEYTEGLNVWAKACLIASIRDIDRFEKPSHLVSYLGYNPGTAGVGYDPEARQVLNFMIAKWAEDPSSEWGEKIEAAKIRLKEKRPELPEAIIEQFARIRVTGKFIRKLYYAWKRLGTSQDE